MPSENPVNGMPIKITLDAGTYYRCQCGKSANLPFCDGAHTAGEQLPLRFEIKKRQKVYLCGCGGSQKAPFCDESCGVQVSKLDD